MENILNEYENGVLAAIGAVPRTAKKHGKLGPRVTSLVWHELRPAPTKVRVWVTNSDPRFIARPGVLARFRCSREREYVYGFIEDISEAYASLDTWHGPVLVTTLEMQVEEVC